MGELTLGEAFLPVGGREWIGGLSRGSKCDLPVVAKSTAGGMDAHEC